MRECSRCIVAVRRKRFLNGLCSRGASSVSQHLNAGRLLDVGPSFNPHLHRLQLSKNIPLARKNIKNSSHQLAGNHFD